MTRVLRSATKKIQSKDDLPSNLSVSKKSKIIKRKDNKIIKVKGEDKKQSDIWNIDSILSSIFAYANRKDLIKFNTVCKKWNKITNPIIHKTIKLIRKRALQSRAGVVFDTTNKKYADAELVKCISNNSKHAHLVKEFRYNYRFVPRRAIKVFDTFRFICILTIERCTMSQGEFLAMISPLTQLQELDISDIRIEKTIRNKVYKEDVQLPHTLKILRLCDISLFNNPELFVQTINSHSNLVEFASIDSEISVFLEPFYKNYPSLLNFELYNTPLESSQSLFKIFDSNPQLVSLKLGLEDSSGEIASHIGSYFINLEGLKLNIYGRDSIKLYKKYTQQTKIKKLNLEWARLTNCSLNSILSNCPHLEELNLLGFTLTQPNSYKFTFTNLVKLKKIVIYGKSLGGDVIDYILLNCTNISELDVYLPFKPKEMIRSICEKCTNLKRVKIRLCYDMNVQESDAIYQEFYESEFFTGNHKLKSTLTHLILDHFEFQDSKAEYFKSFINLKSVKYPYQYSTYYDNLNQETQINIDSWPGYRLIVDGEYSCNFELKRNQTS